MKEQTLAAPGENKNNQLKIKIKEDNIYSKKLIFLLHFHLIHRDFGFAFIISTHPKTKIKSGTCHKLIFNVVINGWMKPQ